MSNFRSIVCDLDGVLYLGSEPVPGAGDALGTLDAGGLDLWFVTNNSTRTPENVANKIALRTGYPGKAGQVVTSALSAAGYLTGEVATALVIGDEGLIVALTEAGIDVVDPDTDHDPAAIDAVVVGLDYTISYRRLAAATHAVRAGARLVASNNDATFPTPQGPAPGAGAIVAAIERATGRDAEPCGKPHPPMRRLLADRLAPGDVLVVGDRIDTDLALGWAEGWATALVLTGIGSAAEAGERKIDFVLDSITDLPNALGM